LLLMDEVQSGVGRTGRLFAHEWSGITPDIMAVAKGIGGGFPMGAFLATKEAAKGMTAGVHGTTYGGNPLAMAVGNAVLDIVADPAFLAQVERMGLLMKQRLAALHDRYPSVIAEVRGQGLLMGLRMHVPNTEMTAELRQQRMLAIPAGDNVVRLLPPLIIGEAEADAALVKLEAACAAIVQRQRVAARSAAE
jgi:acetylornithine/N-succinyldiaminopimelate aminotransferase